MSFCGHQFNGWLLSVVLSLVRFLFFITFINSPVTGPSAKYISLSLPLGVFVSVQYLQIALKTATSKIKY